MKTMFELIQTVSEGRWFKAPSPFRCVTQQAHPNVCIITGPNMSGKSLLRKVLHNHYDDQGISYKPVSQEGRCSSTGIQRLWVYGTETDESTGYNSVKMVRKAVESSQGYANPHAFMLDEPEIGCSDETQAGMGDWLGQMIPTMPNLHTLFVVTHSRLFVEYFLRHLSPTHWRLSHDNVTLAEWANRAIVPTDLDELMDINKERWHIVNKMIKEGKKHD